MLIVRHLGTPNSSSLLASLDATLCAIQYYPDQWVHLKYGTAPYFFSHVTNIKYQHGKDLLTTLF